MAHQTARATVRGHTPARGPDAQPARPRMPSPHDRALARLASSTPLGSWPDRAACNGADIDLFFTVEGESRDANTARTEQAKQICEWCPVRTECLTYALRRPERYGVWGGLDEDERASERRRRMRREANAARADRPVDEPADEPAQAACG